MSKEIKAPGVFPHTKEESNKEESFEGSMRQNADRPFEMPKQKTNYGHLLFIILFAVSFIGLGWLYSQQIKLRKDLIEATNVIQVVDISGVPVPITEAFNRLKNDVINLTTIEKDGRIAPIRFIIEEAIKKAEKEALSANSGTSTPLNK